MSETWELVDGYEKSTNYETEVQYRVNYKTIPQIDEPIIVGEQNSQYMEFIIDRYEDGIDLSEKKIKIYSEIKSQIDFFVTDAINVYKNDDCIKLGWIVPEYMCMESGNMKFCIAASGKEDDKNYLWQSYDGVVTIKDGAFSYGSYIDINDGSYETENKYVNFMYSTYEPQIQDKGDMWIRTSSADIISEYAKFLYSDTEPFIQDKNEMWIRLTTIE